MSIIWTILIGFVIGLVARAIKPGNDSAGFIVTTVLGVLGSLVATYVGQAMNLYAVGEPAGFIASVLGAIVLLALWGLIKKKVMSDAAALRERIARIFTLAPFVGELGIELEDLGPGWCQTALPVARRHLQHGGVAHAGVISSLADHTAGAAAQTHCGPGQMVVTAEFKINLLRPGTGHRLECRAQVLKAGRSLHVVEAEVHGQRGEERVLVAKFNATMAVIPGDF